MGENAGVGDAGEGTFLDGGGTGDAGANQGAGDAGAGEGDAGAAPWQEALPEEIRNEASLRRYGDAAEAHKAYVSLEKKMGAGPDSFILKLKDGATPEDIAKFHTALGRPDTPEAYQLPQTDGSGDFQADADYVSDFRKAAFEAGLSSAQVARIYTALVTADTAQAERIEKAGFQEITTKLTAEWGTEFAAKKALAERALATFPDQTRQLFKVAGLNNDAGFVQQMATYGATMAEHGAPGGGEGGIGTSPEGAKREYSAFIRDKGNQEVLRTPSHPEYREKSEKYTALVQAMGEREG